MELNSWLSTSAKQRQNPSSGPPMCVSGLENMPGLDCLKCHCLFANHVEGKLKMLVIHLVRQGPEQGY